MKEATMQDIKKQVFAPSQMEAAQTEAQRCMELVTKDGGVTQFNFDPEKEFPAGYALAILPLNKKDAVSKKTVTVGVCVGAVPTVELLKETAEGLAFADDAVVTALSAKLANAARPRDGATEAASLPYSVTDFITTNRPEGVLVAFRKLAGSYVKLLKERGMRLMNEATLREIMQSAAFAEQLFPNVPQATWEKILDSMIAQAEKLDMIAGQMVDWKETRTTAGMPIDEELDLADLDLSDL